MRFFRIAMVSVCVALGASYLFADPGAVFNSSVSLGKKTVAPGTTTSNLDSSASYVRLEPTSDFTISGIKAGQSGQMITLFNTASLYHMTLTDLDSGASAGDRILTNTGASLVSVKTSAATLIYDSDEDSGNGAWVVVNWHE